MKLSIALCTYNGARFLPELLESLLAQNRTPDEVVASDDGSTDESVTLLRRFMRSAPFHVALLVREPRDNRGSSANFELAIRKCTGDVIALCDQDDIWLSHKLATIERAFGSSSKPVMVFSDAELIDERSNKTGERLWDCVGFNQRRRRRVQRGDGFEVIRDRNCVTGATMAFKSTLRDIALPIPTDLPLMIHDAWISIIAAAAAPIAHVDERLVLYRQHAGQQVGVSRWGRFAVRDADHYQEHLRVLVAIIQRLHAKPAVIGTDRCARCILSLSRHIAHLCWRIALPTASHARIAHVVRGLAGYFQYSNGLASVTRDLVFRRDDRVARL